MEVIHAVKLKVQTKIVQISWGEENSQVNSGFQESYDHSTGY